MTIIKLCIIHEGFLNENQTFCLNAKKSGPFQAEVWDPILDTDIAIIKVHPRLAIRNIP